MATYLETKGSSSGRRLGIKVKYNGFFNIFLNVHFRIILAGNQLDVQFLL
jgi:hypothetical protein